MATYLKLNENYIQDGLGTLTFTVPTTGNYSLYCQTTVNPASSLTIVVNKNGSPVYTAPVFTPTQSALQFKTDQIFTAADSVTVVFASSAAVDNLLNSIQSNLSIGQGF